MLLHIFYIFITNKHTHITRTVEVHSNNCILEYIQIILIYNKTIQICLMWYSDYVGLLFIVLYDLDLCF